MTRPDTDRGTSVLDVLFDEVYDDVFSEIQQALSAGSGPVAPQVRDVLQEVMGPALDSLRAVIESPSLSSDEKGKAVRFLFAFFQEVKFVDRLAVEIWTRSTYKPRAAQTAARCVRDRIVGTVGHFERAVYRGVIEEWGT